MSLLGNRTVLTSGAILSLAMLAGAGLLYGQAATASLSGTVTDSTNAAVPSAAVTIKNTATSASRTAITDAQGRYSVPDLPIGTYDVSAMKTGFQTAVHSGVTLTVGSAPVVDLQLAVGQTTESSMCPPTFPKCRPPPRRSPHW